MPHLDLQLEFGGLRLVGCLRGLYQKGLFTFSSGCFYAHQLLALWIRHLLLNLLRPDGIEPQSCWLEREGGGRLRPVDAAEPHLRCLLDLYWQGLASPLHFYPGTSWAYSETLQKRADPQAAYQAAVNKWRGNDFVPGDGDKPYHRLLMPGDVMLDQALIETSDAVFGPLMAHLEDAG
jgi:exodeoxyribonuclease V gamma subunit